MTWRFFLQSSMSLAAFAAATESLTSVARAEGPILLEDIVVESASRDARSVLDATTGVTVVDRGEMDRRQASDFEGLIGDTPGLTIEGGPRGAAQEPNIRGFSDDQVVLRLDGGRFNFNQGHRGRFFIDPEIVERVEVIRGGGSTLHGSGALGGVISIETRNAYDMLEPGETMGARLRTSYETNGDAFGQTGTVYGATGGFDALGFLAYRDKGADYRDGDGVDIRASEVDIGNGLAKLGYEMGESSRIEGIFSIYRDDSITPGAQDTPATGGNIVDRDAETLTGRLSWDYDPVGDDLIDLSVLAYFNTLDIDETRQIDGRRDTTDYDTIGFEALNRSRFDAGVPVELVYGVEFVRDTQSGTRDSAARLQFPDATATTYAGFAEATIEVAEGLTIIPGIRFDRYELDPDGAFSSRNESQFSPRIGVSYRPIPQLQFYGNLARAFRAPSLTELYTDDVHFAVPGFPLGPGSVFTGVNEFQPNPDLKPETSDQIEVGARFSDRDVIQAGDALSFSIGGYYARVDNFIDQQVSFIDFSTGQFNPLTGNFEVGGSTTNFNVDAELWGAEAEIRYDAGLWYAGLGLTVPRGENDSGDALSSLPQDRLTATVGFRPTDEFDLGLRATLARKLDNGTANADGYEVFDAYLAYEPKSPPFEGITIRAGVDNIFDETYRIQPSQLNEPGRTFKIAGSIRF
ncbi:TonB-dependent hemoglobin/transferrin/lactoferrin family receptor [Pikeienuella piscinae]|uniref:TonB-dependent hemoglobin/transferrin/lactoferrin family receptor n=1 Tax=Pikeienuella piscinae TaxID=2748098 RepID=A0A7L5C0P5_9RHOB|nr:TonB-dependent hemoglobin/transferrin/lactoferrin family receptor [Pikeienuella piscinae]QIE56963.1 TonB-dependent hemoglobin/transferrin/lactoferrin family receptor [Pikeienuella piscinae]